MQTEKNLALAQSDLFQGLASEDIDELEHIATLLTCAPGHILYRPGEVGNALFLLKEGTIHLYHLSTDGRKLLIGSLEAGASLGETSLTGQRVYDSFAEATVPSRIYILSTHELEQLIVHKPSIAHALLQKLGQRLISLESQLVDTTFKSVSARLATLLLQLASSAESPQQQRVVRGFSHEELADRLGVYRETVSAALRELKEGGVIEPGRKRITIHQPAQLAAIAESAGKSNHS